MEKNNKIMTLEDMTFLMNKLQAIANSLIAAENAEASYNLGLLVQWVHVQILNESPPGEKLHVHSNLMKCFANKNFT